MLIYDHNLESWKHSFRTAPSDFQIVPTYCKTCAAKRFAVCKFEDTNFKMINYYNLCQGWQNFSVCRQHAEKFNLLRVNAKLRV